MHFIYIAKAILLLKYLSEEMFELMIWQTRRILEIFRYENIICTLQ